MHVLRFGNKLNEEVSRGFIFANLFNSLYLLVKSWWNILVANLATNFQDLVVKVEKFSCIGACIGCNFTPCITESFWVSGDELCSFVSRQSHFWCRSWHSTTTLQVFINWWGYCLWVAICSTLVCCYWCISILIIIPVVRWCSLMDPHKSADVLFDRGYPSFRSVDSTIPNDVVGMKSSMDIVAIFRVMDKALAFL